MADMTFAYENSDPERFQQLVQALFLVDFPGLQCLPVAQKDKGRDAMTTVAELRGQQLDGTVLQVKFKRRDSEVNNAKWMIAALEGELEKITLLIAGGMKKYIMVTNASGSVGAVDSVRRWLSANVAVEAACFWRGDVDRRLEGAHSTLKFAYPEVLSGSNALQLALESRFTAEHARRAATVRAFVKSQFLEDEKVKFKQVDLSNDILDLFIDGPVSLPTRLLTSREGSRDISEEVAAVRSIYEASPRRRKVPGRWGGQRPQVGAAHFLLSPAGQQHHRRVVLQGAPGQGKSTLAQYVCQVHRAHMLNKSMFLDRLPQEHRNIALRTPVKVDLRDYAQYLEGRPPFDLGPGPNVRSLEQFLAVLVQHGSGGRSFSIDDAADFLQHTPVLLFLDGLDEVPNAKSRQSLVDSIQIGLDRLDDDGADLQVVVTSRPSTFGKLPAFGAKKFLSMKLSNISGSDVTEFANKWVSARNLNTTDGEVLKEILRAKLELAHIRDLTRNPMQLTILLNLIHTVGYSLPDERTDLYGKYIDVFLTREADKEETVREHRKLLVELIQFIAWYLQVGAEGQGSGGAIERAALKDLVRSYLDANLHTLDILNDIFDRGIERIFVLVERNEGFFEFEVQPLREYFCARHMFDTAPVATPRHQEPKGDRWQRFAAIAQNPYWMNVTRFYAGLYTSGELASLLLGLREQIDSEDAAVSIHARQVSMALLSDWVFRGKKQVQNELISIVFDERGVALGVLESSETGVGLQLDIDCGRDVLRGAIFSQMKNRPSTSFGWQLAGLMSGNGGEEFWSAFAAEIANTSGADRSAWLDLALQSGAASSSTREEYWTALQGDGVPTRELYARVLTTLQESGSLVYRDKRLIALVIAAGLDGASSGFFRMSGPLEKFIGATGSLLGQVHVMAVSSSVTKNDAGSDDNILQLPEALLRYVSDRELDGDSEVAPDNSPIRDFQQEIELVWHSFGESWLGYILALRGAGLQDSSWRPPRPTSLYVDGSALLAAARYARLYSGRSVWWVSQLQLATTVLQKQYWLALLICWGTEKVLVDLENAAIAELESLSGEERVALVRGLAAVGVARAEGQIPVRRSGSAGIRDDVLRGLADVAASGSIRSAEPYLGEGILLSPSEVDAEVIAEVKAIGSWTKDDTHNNKRVLDVLRKVDEVDRRIYSVMRQPLPVEIANEVWSSPLRYPAWMLSRAVVTLQKGLRPPRVGRTAEVQGWEI